MLFTDAESLNVELDKMTGPIAQSSDINKQGLGRGLRDKKARQLTSDEEESSDEVSIGVNYSAKNELFDYTAVHDVVVKDCSQSMLLLDMMCLVARL